ncbi:hypothetical protein U0070_018488 [Myodes glareolus]|uniref:Uncharacterized protein n=1 Tax=Myodes glareolus TaxID=447135 RepID=A0AAW0JV99_MYOGA
MLQEGSVVLWSEQQFENPEVRALSLVLGDREATRPQSLRAQMKTPGASLKAKLEPFDELYSGYQRQK